jgi:hypothetical protein
MFQTHSFIFYPVTCYTNNTVTLIDLLHHMFWLNLYCTCKVIKILKMSKICPGFHLAYSWIVVLCRVVCILLYFVLWWVVFDSLFSEVSLCMNFIFNSCSIFILFLLWMYYLCWLVDCKWTVKVVLYMLLFRLELVFNREFVQKMQRRPHAMLYNLRILGDLYSHEG